MNDKQTKKALDNKQRLMLLLDLEQSIKDAFSRSLCNIEYDEDVRCMLEDCLAPLWLSMHNDEVET